MLFFLNKKIIILPVLLFLAMAGTAQAANTGNSTGHAWGEKTGFISFDGTNASVDYGVTVGDAGLTGYVWSEKLGWISFKDQSGGGLYEVTNDGQGNLSGYAWGEQAGYISFKDVTIGTHSVKINGSTGVFTGYAWGEKTGWINLNDSGSFYSVVTTWRAAGAPPENPPAGGPGGGGAPGGGGGGGSNCLFHNINGFVWSSNMGWISLSCQNTMADIDYGTDIDFDAGDVVPMIGYAWSPNAGWVDWQPAGPYPTAPNHGALFTRADPTATSTAGTITGWGKIAALGSDGWIKLGPLDISSNDYGVQIDENRSFSGWAWNGGDNIDADPEAERGTGWISWRGQEYGAGAVARWFETLYGDIFGGSNIDAAYSPPAGRYSATYLIQSNGTINPVTIRSGSGVGAPYVDNSFDSLSLPKAANSYRGSLGNLDRVGLLNGYYGDVTVFEGNNNSSDTLGTSLILDNRVYHFKGNLTVDSVTTFSKGNGSQKGRGTVVVDGDLIINANTAYGAGAVAGKIDNLPSVAWLVKGNIIFNPSVTAAVGLYYSEGVAGIATGTTGAPETDLALSIKGMLIGKKIRLERLFIGADNTPSEQITFDGRALVNPPPGLADIVKGLPTLREVSP